MKRKNQPEQNCWEYWDCGKTDCPVFLQKEGSLCYTLDAEYCIMQFMRQKNAQFSDCRDCGFFRKMEIGFKSHWDKLRKELYRLQDFEGKTEEEIEYKKNIFKERTLSLSLSVEEKKITESLPFSVFNLNKEQYGIEVGFVSEVYPVKNISAVPCTPKYFLGITNYRGEILTIIDLKNFLGINNITAEKGFENKEIIVVFHQGIKAGLLVDKVGGVEEFSLKELYPPFSVLSNENKKYIKGELRKDKNLTIVLDIEKIMHDEKLFVEYIWE